MCGAYSMAYGIMCRIPLSVFFSSPKLPFQCMYCVIWFESGNIIYISFFSLYLLKFCHLASGWILPYGIVSTKTTMIHMDSNRKQWIGKMNEIKKEGEKGAGKERGGSEKACLCLNVEEPDIPKYTWFDTALNAGNFGLFRIIFHMALLRIACCMHESGHVAEIEIWYMCHNPNKLLVWEKRVNDG